MADTFEKVDNSTIRVTKPIPATEKVNSYDLDFLIAQEASITQQRDELIALKTAELAEVQKYISEAQKLGIKTRAEAEPVVEEEAITP